MTGIVAHTYPEWWLKLAGQVAHWSSDYSYVATNFLINLKEIILGPKFLNRTDVMPYLQEQVDIMCQKLGINVPKITSSDIALM